MREPVLGRDKLKQNHIIACEKLERGNSGKEGPSAVKREGEILRRENSNRRARHGDEKRMEGDAALVLLIRKEGKEKKATPLR